jgi:hypothetical protein
MNSCLHYIVYHEQLLTLHSISIFPGSVCVCHYLSVQRNITKMQNYAQLLQPTHSFCTETLLTKYVCPCIAEEGISCPRGRICRACLCVRSPHGDKPLKRRHRTRILNVAGPRENLDFELFVTKRKDHSGDRKPRIISGLNLSCLLPVNISLRIKLSSSLQFIV